MRLLSNDFWNELPINFGEYLDGITEDSPIANSAQGKDAEMQILFEMYLVGTGLPQPQAEAEAAQSRVNTRRRFLAQWTDYRGPFTDEEIVEGRRGVRPWVVRQRAAS